MEDITALKKEYERYASELAALREQVPANERGEHAELQDVRAKRNELGERIEEIHARRRRAGARLADYADYWRAVAAGERGHDDDLAERLRSAVLELAPTATDDPRLAGWYHTIDLGQGLYSQGKFDLGPTVERHALPQSLEGKTALDVGTCDGFWAFELERRGAERVVAVDVERWGDFDWLPWVRESKGEDAAATRMDKHFWLAHAMRGSRVEHRLCSVYELSPETFGTFDFVFCGSLLMHLFSPFHALMNIRAMTREQARIATLIDERLERTAPDHPSLSFGHRWPDLASDPPMLGAQAVYWHMNARGLCELMEYAGFARTKPLGTAQLLPTEAVNTVVAGYIS